MLLRPGLVSFLASLLFASPAAAYCRLYTQSPSTAAKGDGGCVELGHPLKWQHQCISYTLVPSEEVGLAVDDLRAAIDRSFATWMAVECGDPATPLPLVLGQTEELGACEQAEYNRYGPNANTIVFVSDWASRGADYVPEAYGLTLVWHNPEDGQILDADIQINLNRGAIQICGAECSGLVVDLQNVLTHEAGHFIGLAHSDKPLASMYGDAPIAQTSKRVLIGDDIAGACAIYGGDAQPVCVKADYAPRRGFTAECSQPPESSACAMRAGAPSRGVLAACALALVALAWAVRRRT